jgi:hypothetical protein
MLDDADTEPHGFDPPDADTLHAHYLETCRRLGIVPVPRDRALFAEWSDAIATRRIASPITH